MLAGGGGLQTQVCACRDTLTHRWWCPYNVLGVVMPGARSCTPPFITVVGTTDRNTALLRHITTLFWAR